MKALGKGSLASWVKIGLDVMWVLLWIGAAGLALAAVGAAALHVLGPTAMTEAVDIAVDIAGVNISGVAAQRLGAPLMVMGLVAAAVGLAAGLIIVDRLRRLFQSFSSNAPFARANAGHLRMIWVTLLAAEMSRYLIGGAAVLTMTAFGRPEGVALSVSPSVNLSTWAAILVLVVLAEVFAEGARMREEQDLTI